MAGHALPLVRDLHWEDFEPLLEAYYLCYEERAAGFPIGIHLFADRPSREAEVDWFASVYRRVSEGSTVGAVAEIDGKAVGSCLVSRRGGEPGSEVAHVGELGILVHRDFRSRGVGSALLAEVLERCRGRFEVVVLSVFATNEGARRLYQSVGLSLTGTVPRAVRRNGQYIDLDQMAILL